MTKALIIGSGIAGPVAAMALQRAGIAATIYEARTPDQTDGGAFLSLAVNGLDALSAIDAHHQVLETGFASPTIELRSGTGKLLGQVPLGGVLPDGTVTRTVRRADLYCALLGQAWDRGIPIEHGKRLRAAELTRHGRVLAKFEDGTERVGDLLIGADGIFSRTRRIIDPSAPEPRYTGLANTGGFAPPGTVAGEPGKYVMTFGRRAFFGYVPSPDGDILWFANLPRRPELSREQLAAMGPEEWTEWLIELFRDDDGPTLDIIRSTTEWVPGTNQHDLARVPVWHRGPMIVIGDAAHAATPTSGQGASLAMEDAVVLARCLRDLPDTAAAFAAYEQLRRPRVERIVAQAARMNSSKAPGPMVRAVRDLLLPVFLRRQANAAGQRWIFEHHIDWEASVQPARAA